MYGGTGTLDVGEIEVMKGQGLLNYARSRRKRRLDLARTWTRLLRAGITYPVLEAEYGYNHNTIRAAASDPIGWSEKGVKGPKPSVAVKTYHKM